MTVKIPVCARWRRSGSGSHQRKSRDADSGSDDNWCQGAQQTVAVRYVVGLTPTMEREAGRTTGYR